MKSLIVLGASVRAAAFSALRAGLEPYASDPFRDRDLAAVCTAVKIRRYPGEFLSVLAAAPQAPWIYAGGLENYPRLVDRLAAVRPLLGNRGDVIRGVRDPLRLAEAAKRAECLMPKRGGAPGVFSGDGTAWLVKPLRSSGGLGIRAASLDELAHPPRGTFLQEYVAGESASAVFVAAAGRALLLGVTRQLHGRDFGLDRPFLYVGSIGPLQLSRAESSQLDVLGNELAEHFAMSGLFNIDFLRTAKGVCVLEVNPRYSASMEVLERVSGACFIATHLAACEGGGLLGVPVASGGRFAGKAVVYARQTGAVRPALDRLVAEWNKPGDTPGIADLPAIGDKLIRGQPAVTILVDGSSPAEVEANLRDRVSLAEERLV